MEEDIKIYKYKKSHYVQLVDKKKRYSIKLERVKIDREKINRLIEEIDRPIAKKSI